MKVESTRAVNLTLVLSIVLFKKSLFSRTLPHGIIKNILLTELLGLISEQSTVLLYRHAMILMS